MTHGDAVVKPGQGSSQSGRGIALNKEGVGLFAFENGIDKSEHPGTNLCGSLIRLHDSKVVVDLQAEKLHKRMQQLGVLT